MTVLIAGCVLGPAAGTKGTMPPPGPNGEVDPSAMPDFIAVAGHDGIAGYAPKEAVLAGGDQTWPVFASDLRTLVGHLVPGRGFVPLGVDPGSVPTFAATVAPGEPPPMQGPDVVRAYVRNGGSVETWIAVWTLGRVQPGGAGFPGSGYVGVACLHVPTGSQLVLLNHSPVDPGALPRRALHDRGSTLEPVSLWVDVARDGTINTGTGRPAWWTSDPPC